MKIEIWSDIACPYCYIGKRKLELALAEFPNKNNVEIIWNSYELNPDRPKVMSEASFYEYFSEGHNMSIEQTKDTLHKLEVLAKEVGLDYDFSKAKAVNTSDALRLVKLAKEYGVADQVEELLFKAYFIDGESIADKQLLLQIASTVNIGNEEVRKTLDNNTYLDQIKKDMEYSENELGLEYIPFYRFNEKHIIQGSIAVEDYLSVLKKAYAEWESGDSSGESDLISGQSCSIDGVCG